MSASRNSFQTDPQISIANITSSRNGYGIDIRRPGGVASLPVEMINVISWRNIEGDLRLQRRTRLSYSIVGIMDLASPSALHPDSRENHGSDPQLSFDMRLRETSPAINSGSNAAFPGTSINHATDVWGTTRLIGERVDRGATESYED